MAAPTRPIAGAPIATDWGEAVHDADFFPKGTLASSVAVTIAGTTVSNFPLTVGGPNLSGGAFVVPQDGVYLVKAGIEITTAGTTPPTSVRARVQINGANGPSYTTGIASAVGIGTLVELVFLHTFTAGQLVTLQANSGQGATAGCQAIAHLHAVKVGEALS